MFGWIAQWYVKVPAVSNVIVALPPAGISPVSNAPLSPVAVWATESIFVQVTDDPAVMVTEFGEKAKFWIETFVASWAAAGPPPNEKNAANASATASAVAAAKNPKRVVRIRMIDPSRR
jgi:hypothetical protein